jgi:hypothetical protein
MNPLTTTQRPATKCKASTKTSLIKIQSSSFGTTSNREVSLMKKEKLRAQKWRMVSRKKMDKTTKSSIIS